MPSITPKTSAIQSLTSELRLKLGWTEFNEAAEGRGADQNGQQAKRPVRAIGKASAAKAIRWKSLSLPSGAWGGCSRGNSMATVSMSVAMRVRGMSRYLRIKQGYWSE